VLFIAELEHVRQLVVDVFLEHVFVCVVIKSITEDTKQLVNPEFYDILLAFIEPVVSQVNSLENLGHISHIENVMRLSRSRQKLFLNQEE